MSLAWIGRRAVRYLLACGAVAACAYFILRPEPPRVGYARAIAGVPLNRTLPVIGGDLRLGGVVTCAAGTWDGTYTYDYQWVRDNVDLTGETTVNHTVGQADVGHYLRCDVRASSDEGASAESGSNSFSPPYPAALTPPRVSGDLRLGRTLSCTRGSWN